MSALAGTYRDQREFLDAIEREFTDGVLRNCRLLELARHNGYEIETHPTRDGKHRIWIVPREFVPIAGFMAAVVR